LYCKFCGAILSDDLNECPACGASLSEENAIIEDEIVEVPEEETVDDTVPSSADGCEAYKKPKNNKLAIVSIILAVLLVFSVSACVVLSVDGLSDKVKAFFTDVFSKPTKERFNPDDVVAEFGEHKLTNAELTYYYYGDYYYWVDLMTSYGMALFDTSKPLSQQNYDENQTWEEFFINSAITSWQSTMILNDLAKRDNYVLPQDIQTDLNNMGTALTESATANGFSSAEEYIVALFGDYASLEGYKKYMQDSQYSGNYYYELYNEKYQQYLYQLDGLDEFNVSVRHILIEPSNKEDDATWTVAEQEATRIYNEWLSGVATEESFGEYAKQYTADGNGSVGGLYEDFAQGQMVEAFDSWCFDESRNIGDHGIVKTEFGYHIMYFVARTNPNAASTAQEEADQIITNVIETASITKHLDLVTIKDGATK